jgi:hypothetical protein
MVYHRIPNDDSLIVANRKLQGIVHIGTEKIDVHALPGRHSTDVQSLAWSQLRNRGIRLREDCASVMEYTKARQITLDRDMVHAIKIFSLLEGTNFSSISIDLNLVSLKSIKI